MQTLILATLDASGALFAPGGGGITIAPSLIEKTPAAFPSLVPVLANRMAFTISAPIPADLLGAPLRVFFDLFDNQDLAASLGYFSGAMLVPAVPEPQTGALVLLAVTAWLAGRNARQKRASSVRKD